VIFGMLGMNELLASWAGAWIRRIESVEPEHERATVSRVGFDGENRRMGFWKSAMSYRLFRFRRKRREGNSRWLARDTRADAAPPDG
jgi:hypothetical protein